MLKIAEARKITLAKITTFTVFMLGRTKSLMLCSVHGKISARLQKDMVETLTCMHAETHYDVTAILKVDEV